MDGAVAAQVFYLRALEVYTQLPPADDTTPFLSEHCEVLAEVEDDPSSSSTLQLLAEIAEEKFGAGSIEHLDLLRQMAEVWTESGRIQVAAQALASGAKSLQAMCEQFGGGCTRSDAAPVVEAAAKALEAAMPSRLEQGDLEGAIEVWQEAIAFREFLWQDDLVSAMRNALEALVHALGRRG